MEFSQLKNGKKTYTTRFFKTGYYLLQKKPTIQSNAKKSSVRKLQQKVTVKKNGKEKIIEVNREIIGTLLALSGKHDKLINFETTSQYCLCPGPLSLAQPDGTRRETMKSSKKL